MTDELPSAHFQQQYLGDYKLADKRNSPRVVRQSMSDMIASPYEPQSDYKPANENFENSAAQSFLLGSTNTLEQRILKKQAEIKESQSRSIAQIKNNTQNLDDSDDLSRKIVSARTSQQTPSQIQRLVMQVNQIDEKLGSAKNMTDTKFQQLNDQMNLI